MPGRGCSLQASRSTTGRSALFSHRARLAEPYWSGRRLGITAVCPPPGTSPCPIFRPLPGGTPRTLSRERRNPMDHHEPRAQHSDDRAVAAQRPCATRQLTGLPRLARGGFWLGVALCGVGLGGCSSSTSGPVQPTGVGAAAKLVFTVQPSNAAAGAANTPAVQVAVQDAQG